MEFHKVFLYYPNTWRRYIGDLVKLEDKKFNWFLCSKRYFDESISKYIVEIAPETKFYEQKTGITFKIDPDRHIKLLIVEKQIDNKTLQIIYDKNLDGYTSLCDSMGSKEMKSIGKDISVFCHEAEFYFLPDRLHPVKNLNRCELINYAKVNNICIRKIIEEFPTPTEIDYVLEKYPCTTVCRVLFNYIQEYLTKIQ